MSIIGIPAGMTMPVQPYAMSQPGIGMAAYRPMLPQVAATNGAGLLGSPTGITNRFMRAWKAALSELRLGSQSATPLTSTMPLAAKPRTKKAAHKRRARVVKPVRVPSRTPGAIAALRANQAAAVRPMMMPNGMVNPGVFPGMAGVSTMPGMNRGMSMGIGSMGQLNGQPQLNASNQSGLAMGTNGMDQHVTNDNHFDDRGYSVSELPFGMESMYGFGSPYASVLGWGNPMGYMPSSAYGASMTGAWYTQPSHSGIGGFFSRLFGR